MAARESVELSARVQIPLATLVTGTFVLVFGIMEYMNFSEKDKEFMQIALSEAKLALEEGNLPVGAILVIDGKIIDKKRNSLYSGSN